MSQCYVHPDREAVRLRKFRGVNSNEVWQKNVCQECDDLLMDWATNQGNLQVIDILE